MLSSSRQCSAPLAAHVEKRVKFQFRLGLASVAERSSSFCVAEATFP
jgi:hypothetical protein